MYYDAWSKRSSRSIQALNKPPNDPQNGDHFLWAQIGVSQSNLRQNNEKEDASNKPHSYDYPAHLAINLNRS